MNPLAALDKLKCDYTDFLRASFPIRSTLPNLSEELENVVQDDGNLFRGPYLELTPPYKKGATLRELVTEGVLHPAILELSPESLPPDRPLYQHQEQSIRTAVAGGNVCVAAGTGSGKTECFLIPIIDYILKQQDQQLGPGVKAVLMYPMNALVDDQLGRLRQILGSGQGRSITFGRYTGLTRKTDVEFHEDMRSRGAEILPNEIGSRERMRQELPDILLTNFSMLQYLLLRPKDRPVFGNVDPGLWRFLVLDEVHSYRGVQGIEVGMLLRRLMHRVNRFESGMQCFATSATLSSDPEDEALLLQFLEDIFSRSFSEKDGRVIRGQTVSPEENYYFDVPEDDFFSLSEDKLLECPADFFDRDLEAWAELTPDKTEEEFLRGIMGSPLPAWLGGVVQGCATSNELLFEIGRRCRQIHHLVELLTNETVLSVYEIVNRLGFSSVESVRRLIRLGTVARPDVSAHPLVSARYHFFVRGPQGAKVCLNESCAFNPPADENILSSRTTLTGIETCACGRDLYQVGICRTCGQPYIIGYLSPDGHSFFASRDDASERNPRCLVLQSDTLNSEYGAFRDANVNFCSEIDQEVLRESPSLAYVFAAEKIGQRVVPSTAVKRCFKCGAQARAIGNVVSGFGSEGDIAQIVLLQSILQSQGADPKALVFSDSRQGAAKFAVTLSYTAKSALTRQLILRLLAETGGESRAIENLRAQFPNADDQTIRTFLEQAGHDSDQQETGLGLDDLGRRLRRLEEAKKCGLFSDIDTEEGLPEDARARVYAEFATMLNRRLNLCSIGLCKREVELSLDGDGEGELLNIFGPLGIYDSESSYNLLQLLLDTLVVQGVVDRESRNSEVQSNYPVLLPAAPYQNYIILDGTGRKARKAEISWLPRGDNEKNARLMLLAKLARENGEAADDSTLRQILTNVFVFLNEKGIFDQENGNQKIIGLRRVKVSKGAEHWECDTCRQRTFYPVKVKDGSCLCPDKGCRGRLDRQGQDEAPDGFYEKLYSQASPIRLVAKEHTAQLGESATRQYQDSFASEDKDDPNRINVLSSSTTFEMGVDLGDLNAVFLRNIPPEVANYRQRSGRAGRRAGQEPVILTFARSRSHDAFYFASPERMIAGDVRPPALNMANAELRRRHLNAFFMADYLNFLGLVSRTALKLESIWPTAEMAVLPKDFSEWQTSRFNGLRNACTSFASSLKEPRQPESLLEDFIEDLSRIGQGLVGERSNIERRQQELSAQLASADSDLSEVEKALGAIRRESNRLCSEILINFLVKHQVLPGFGFPVHVVELDTRLDSLDLTRDKSIALFEYAPGNTVVADGYAIPSVGLKNSYFEEEEQFFYRICCDCGHADVRSGDNFEQHCTVCGVDLETPVACSLSPRQKMLMPTGFTSDTSRRPCKAGATIMPRFFRRQSFVRFVDSSADITTHPSGVYNTVHSGNAELYIVNSGEGGGKGFRFCTSCRALVAKGTKHSRPYGGECRNQHFDANLHLGHTFRTDAIRIRFAAEAIPGLPAPSDLGFWRSLSYAILKGAVIELQIERNDLGAIVQPYSYGASYGQEIVLYDAVPGGAGYCKYFRNHERVERIVFSALEIVNQCECDPDSSCHRCLRSYDNAAFHRQLKRGPVAEVLARILAIMNAESTFIPFGNATYYLARQLKHSNRQIYIGVSQMPIDSPEGERRAWIDLIAQNGHTQLLISDQSLTQEWLAENPQAVSTCRTLINLLSENALDLRRVTPDQLPKWNVIVEADEDTAAISLKDPDFTPDNTIVHWTYKQEDVSSAKNAFALSFGKAKAVTISDIESLIAPIQTQEILPDTPFNMQDGLRGYYSGGAPIQKAFINDRYIVNCQFDSLAEHIKLIREFGTQENVPVLVFTETPKDFSDRAVQRDKAKAIDDHFPGTDVRLYDHYRKKVKHQRFIILTREDGTFSKLTMDPGIDIISRRQRDNWPEGPVFQRTEIYYIRNYEPTGIEKEALDFLLN